ncbi:MAG TPA: hypothetical protein VNF07_00375 [Acidimicrobiales bacterium]|nr:hypothetical protein [Acidimicrobiales bacterium]
MRRRRWRDALRALTAPALVLGGLFSPARPAAGVVAALTAARCATPLPRLAARAPEVLVTVTAPSFAAVQGELSAYRRSGAACFVRVAGPYPAWLGSGGLSAHHLEGDATTPAGLFGIGRLLYGADPDPGLASPYHRLSCGDWWDEDPRSSSYNRFVHLACGARPSFGGGSEALWRILPAYDALAVVEYNAAPVVPGRGSAIFLHVATGSPTVGCVSVAKAALLSVLRALPPAGGALIAIGTPATLAALRRPENL